jgi:O-antigen ligase
LTFLIFYLIYKNIPLDKLLYIKYPLVIYFLSLAISIFFSIDKLKSFDLMYRYIAALYLFVICATLDLKNKPHFINTIIYSALIISLMAIYQYFFGFQHLLDYMSRNKITEPFVLDYISQKRVFFPFVTPNILGCYLSMTVPLCLINKKTYLLILPISIALLLTKSIGAILSLLIGLIVYFYLLHKLNRKVIIVLATILLIIGLIFILRSNTQKQHIQPIFSIAMRLSYWKYSLMIIKRYALSGVGLGNFNLPQCRYAHNSYLQIWAEMGILGITSILWLILTILKFGLNSLKTNSNKIEISGLFTANIVFLTTNSVDFGFFLPEVVFIWWVILGLLYSSASTIQNQSI